MPNMEPYSVHVPPPVQQPIELHASGVAIGKLQLVDRRDKKFLFVYDINQRIFVEDMIEGVTAYALNEYGATVKYVLFDREYERFEFELD